MEREGGNTTLRGDMAKHGLSWRREDKLIGLIKGNRNNFTQKEDTPVPEAMN